MSDAGSGERTDVGSRADDAARCDGGEATREGATDEAGRPCPRCGAQMYSRHCKYVCPRHGVVYDCSDTFY